jgi:hypothetical protein
VPLAYIFVDQVASWINLLVMLGIVVIEIVALVNCLTQRADAFPVVGSLSKGGWLAILGLALLATVGCWFLYTGISIFAFIAITAAAVYLLDVRPALRDASSGSGGW